MLKKRIARNLNEIGGRVILQPFVPPISLSWNSRGYENPCGLQVRVATGWVRVQIAIPVSFKMTPRTLSNKIDEVVI